MADEKKYPGVLEKIIREGKHGPYAVARCDDLGVVTFALDKPVWNENEWPNPGTYVICSDLRRNRAGWRAQSARFVRPGDENSNQQPSHPATARRTKK